MATRRIGATSPPGTGLQYDEQNRPFLYLGDDPNGKRSYVSPMAMGQPSTLGQGESFLHHRNEWNADTGEINHPINWGNILSASVGAGLGASALTAIPAGMGATSAAAPAAAGTGAGAGMNPVIAGSLLQMIGNVGASAFSQQPQRRQPYTGAVSAQNSLSESRDVRQMLMDVLSNQAPLDLSGSTAPLPDDPSGRVNPRRRQLPGLAQSPNAAPTGRRDGAIQLLRSLGTAA